MDLKKVLKNWKVMIWAGTVFLAILLILNIIPVNKNKGIGLGNGLDYGLDFAGGIQLQLQLERPLDSDTMAIEKGILENRLNSMGLKDIPVRPWGDQYILIQVAGASPEEMVEIENILKQQARFEERIDGGLAVKGDEITVDLTPSGTKLYRSDGGYGWGVVVKLNQDGACRFGKVAYGKFFSNDNPRNRPVDLFIDRPENTSILMSDATYVLLQNISSGEKSRIYYGDSAIKVIENRSLVPVVFLDNSNTSQAFSRLDELKKQGYANVILAGDENQIPNDARNRLEERGFKTTRKPLLNLSYEDWVMQLTGLQSAPRLNFDTRGECTYDAMITGSTVTLDDAQAEIKRTQVLLTSGNLPAKATVESKSTTPPTLGMKFLNYSLIIGLVALITVGAAIFVKYRRLSIAVPIVLTDISEVLIVLGLAAILSWNIDLQSAAGIIAAVGTGVNDQIIITDETSKRKRERREIVSVVEQIKRAFFIIFAAAATIVAAMLPILTIGAGMLKGFAFTTILGVLVGIFITRPGYAVYIKELLQE